MRRVGLEDLCSVLGFAARWEAIWLNLLCAALPVNNGCAVCEPRNPWQSAVEY